MRTFFALLLLVSVFSNSAFGALPPATCDGGVFKPCICASQSVPEIKFREALPKCGNRAAVILEGPYKGAFSVVLRDKLNRDRVIPPGFQHNCTSYEINVLGLNRCSAYKAQRTIRKPNSTTFCFGLRGKQMAKASRITIKLKDDPNGHNDVLIRQCLPLSSAKYDMN